MALVELDDDLVGALNKLLEGVNQSTGAEPWTLRQLIRDMLWDEMKDWQRYVTWKQRETLRHDETNKRYP